MLKFMDDKKGGTLMIAELNIRPFRAILSDCSGFS